MSVNQNSETVSELQRLAEQRSGSRLWQDWGPYLSERQWGMVREDYSPGGTAWEYLPHDHARSRAYRQGEDGIGGFSDRQQRLCLSLAMWNGKDPIINERLFGLTNGEGNHGEDVKELYYYLDALPSHRYLNMLYKYPQSEYPYAALVAENARRGTDEAEYELIDTGIFDEDRYFDIVIEYVQEASGDILLQVTTINRGPDTATLHLLPQLWFRNTWSWRTDARRPLLQQDEGSSVKIVHETLGTRFFHTEGDCEYLFCENDTNVERLSGFQKRLNWYLNHLSDLARLVSRWHEPGNEERRLLSLLRGHRMRRVLQRMLGETEFLSDFGVRALSKYHEDNPYVFDYRGTRLSVNYEPVESTSGLFGGNSNWCGPVWFPVALLLR